MFERVTVSGLQLAWRVLLSCTLASGLMAAAWGSGQAAGASSPVAQSAAESVARQAKLRQSYAKMPMSFEANQGQADWSAKFVARGNGYGLYLTGQDAVLVLRKPAGSPSRKNPKLSAFGVTPNVAGAALPSSREASGQVEAAAKAPRFTTDVVRMELDGASTNAQPVGQDKLPGTVNYFLGNDPARWRSAIPTYGKVRYNGVYPGVDLLYYGNQGQLEYDFVVAAGADPKPIRLHFEGASKLSIDATGNLAIASANGSISFHKPEVYQSANGVKKAVAGSFKLLAGNSVGFHLGSYDHARPLVIDPILAYSTYFGGTNVEFVVAVTSDASGNAYVTGLTASEDFPLTAGAFQSVDYATPTNDVSTAFISKFNPSGSALLYSTFLGGVAIPNTLHEQGDYGKAIAVDAAGNAYVTGYTYSSDFPITSGAFQKGNQAAAIGLATGFVTKLNPSGTALVYSTYLGGNTLDELTAIAIDAAGDAFISGISFSSNFPTTSGVLQATNRSFAQNGYNSVITKLNPTGSALIYSTYLGGSGSDGSTLGNIYWTNPIVVDGKGNAYVAGFTSSRNFPVTAGAYQTTNTAVLTITVSKLNPTASALLYSTYLGGVMDSTNGCVSEGLAVDSAGNAYVAGYTDETDFPVTKGAFQTVNKADVSGSSNSADSNQNGFLSKINPTGSALVYSTYLGGTTGPWGGDQIYDLAVDSAGDAYVAGSAMSDDFPVTANAYQSKNKGATHCCDYYTYTSNAFLTEFNPTGTGLIYSTYLGGTGTQNPNGPGGSGDTAYGLALGHSGTVYLVGFASSSNFPVTLGAFETKYHSNQNTGFVAEFDLGVSPQTIDTVTTLTASANPVIPGTSVTFTAQVAQTSGMTVPTGSIVFSVDEATVATVALSAGKATYTTSSLVAGAHYVVANYAGNTAFGGSGDGFNEFITPDIPVITPPGGTYTSQQTVTVTDATKGSVLYYTLDGSTPSVFTAPYTTPFTVNAAKTIKVVAVSEHDASSVVVTAAYNILGSPSVLAGPATGISTPKATLNAYVNTLGIAGTYYFQYGTSSKALTSTTAKTALAASASRVQISAPLTALAAKTTYYYQVVVTTAGGTVTSGVQSFTTN